MFSADGGEADHFLGQHSPPAVAPVSRSDSSVALFAGEPSNDSFNVGYGSAPLAASTEVPDNTLGLITTVTAPSQHNELTTESTPIPSAVQSQPPNPQGMVSCCLDLHLIFILICFNNLNMCFSGTRLRLYI